jgi:nucleoside 2-deoxyribosyltransferase
MMDRFPKVYLAAPFAKQDEIATYAEELRALGIVVTSRWLDEPESSSETDVQQAQRDLADIDNADVLISFTEPPAFKDYPGIFISYTNPRGGRHVEFGYALAQGKEVWVVGYRENIFHHLPQVKFFPSWSAVMAEAFSLKEWFA